MDKVKLSNKAFVFLLRKKKRTISVHIHVGCLNQLLLGMEQVVQPSGLRDSGMPKLLRKYSGSGSPVALPALAELLIAGWGNDSHIARTPGRLSEESGHCFFFSWVRCRWPQKTRQLTAYSLGPSSLGTNSFLCLGRGGEGREGERSC